MHLLRDPVAADRVRNQLEAVTAEWGWGHWFVVTTLLAEAVLLKQPGATVIYDLRASHAVRDTAARYGGKALMNSYYAAAERMGVPFGAIESAAHDVWALDESHMGPASAPVAVEPPKRPWWKLW